MVNFFWPENHFQAAIKTRTGKLSINLASTKIGPKPSKYTMVNF